MSISDSPKDSPSEKTIQPGQHHRRLDRLRDRERQRRWTIVAVSAIVTVMLLAGLLGIVDFQFETGTAARLIAWAAIAVAAVTLVVTLRRWRTFDSADAVCEAERSRPDIGQRLRTSHDYLTTPEQVSPANPELVRALEAETQERVTREPIEPLGRPWPIFVLLGSCFALAMIWLATFAVLPDWRVATARLLFVPVHYSQVQPQPLPDMVHEGEDIVVRLHVDGRPLKTARVLYRDTGESEWNEASLEPATTGALVDDLSAVIPDCHSDLEIQIEAGHYNSGVHPVVVRMPLVLEQWNAKMQPPAYTGLPPADGSPESLRIPEGSSLELAAKYNRQPSEVEVGVTPPSSPPSPPEIAASVAHLSINADREAMDLTIHAAAADGMADDSSLHIEVVPDRLPALKFIAPAESAEAIPTAELRFTLQAFDDYGLGSVGIRYRIDDGPEQTLWESAPGDPVSAIAKTVALPLEDLDVKYPQALTYYAYAIDNREPKTQRSTSELRFVDIRPFSREYEFKDSQCSGNCQGECLTLEKLIKQQREILGRTFAVNQQSDTTDTIGGKLADQEDDLRTKTESLTAALEQKVGPMPELQDATISMTDAIKNLQAQQIADGQTDEERALADLIAARQNLRKILKQSDSQAQMCRNVDQQQMDKIRKPKRDKEKKQEQQLAQVREQLEQLAKQQESFCQSAKACQQANPSNSSSGKNPSTRQSDAPQSPTREQLAQQQQQSAAKAREIQQRLSQGEFGQLAPKRADQAAKSIEQSGQSMTQPDADAQAIAKAQEAADQLKRLSEHLGRRHNPDFADKLSAAGRQAEQLSAEQQELSESLGRDEDSQAANEQQQLVASAEELVDLVDQLQAESMEHDWQVQRALTEQASTHSPRQATTGMQKAAEAIEQGKTASATENGKRAAGILERFAAGVAEIQQAMGPARLEQLIKAEQRAAALLKESQRAGSEAERAMVKAGARQFSESIQSLARGDAELAEATDAMNKSQGFSSSNAQRRDEIPSSTTAPQLASSPTTLDGGLRNVDEVLQRRIQEAILSGSMQQSVGAVPPEYTQMVEDYYRELSTDVE